MVQEREMRTIEVNEGNVSETGSFCRMSRRKSEGNQRKPRWLETRFAEGMRIKIIKEECRGFIEYIPGEYAWRPVKASGYMLIHCLWVVGKSRGKGCATFLLNECIRDARESGMQGVAMATSEGHWLMGKRLLVKKGFEVVDQAPPSFELMVRKFGDAPSPCFTKDWDAKMSRYGKGLTIVRSDQCPYIEDETNRVVATADELGIQSQVVELSSCQEVQELAPSAYGVYSVVYDGSLLCYHFLTKRQFLKRLDELGFRAGDSPPTR